MMYRSAESLRACLEPCWNRCAWRLIPPTGSHVERYGVELLDGTDDAGCGFIGCLKANEVGRFFIGIDAGDGALLIGELLQIKPDRGGFSAGTGCGVPDLIDEAGVGR